MVKENKSKNREYYTTLASDYENLNNKVVMKNQELHDELLRAIEFEQSKDLKILDLGFGTGELMKMMLEKYKNSYVVGVDFSEDMSGVAKVKLDKFRGRYSLINRDLKGINMKDLGNFDVVISSITIHNLNHNEKKELFKEIYSVLSDGGVFINGDFTMAETSSEQDEFDAFLRNFLEVNLEGKILQDWIEHAFSYDQPMKFSEQTRLLKEIGFRDVEEFWRYKSELIYTTKK